MTNYLTQNTRTRKKDIIEQFGFKKDKHDDGLYRMNLKGIFEDHPQDYLEITLNLSKERVSIWAMPYHQKLGCNSTLDAESMLAKDPEWLGQFFNERIQWAVNDMHIYIYKDMPNPMDEEYAE